MNKLLKSSIFISAIISVASYEIKCAYPDTCLKISDCKNILKDNLPSNFIFRFCGNNRYEEICCPQPGYTTAIIFRNEPETEEPLTIAYTPSISDTTVSTTESTQTNLEFELAKRYLPTETCGWRNNTLKNKVYQGRNAKPGEFPWITLIKIKSGEAEAICGGTLISEWYILTAAHCVYFYDKKSVTITLGATDYRGTRPCSSKKKEKPKLRKAAKIIVHEGYYKDRQLFGGKDIALIRMDKRVNFNDCIQPACLPLGNFGKGLSRENSSLLTAGWGTKGKSSMPSEILQGAEQYFVNNSDCETRYKDQNYKIPILKSQVCTVGKLNARGLKGDSGGPLLSEKFIRGGVNSGIKYILVGILSSGPQDWKSKNAVPNIYTKVNRFLDWVVRNMEA